MDNLILLTYLTSLVRSSLKNGSLAARFVSQSYSLAVASQCMKKAGRPGQWSRER